MLTWKDISSYSQSDKVRTPNSFEAHCGQLILRVHHYMHCGDTWFASCFGLFDTLKLNSKDIEEAKAEAARILTRILVVALEELNA